MHTGLGWGERGRRGEGEKGEREQKKRRLIIISNANIRPSRAVHPGHMSFISLYAVDRS